MKQHKWQVVRSESTGFQGSHRQVSSCDNCTDEKVEYVDENTGEVTHEFFRYEYGLALPLELECTYA